MPPAALYKFPTSSPADTTSLTSLARLGYSKDDILGIVGKTEGNGCVNDFSRTLASLAWDDLIPRTSISIFSGGTEGVLSPHVSFVLQSKERTGLIAAVGRTWQLQPWQIGSKDHVDCVAATVRKMLEAERIKAEDVQMVLIKCPLLTSEKIATINASEHELLTSDTYESMALSRHASAIGIGVALRELQPERVDAVLADGSWNTARASCSSGAELEDCHILILANDSGPDDDEARPTSVLRAFSGVMASAIDYAGLRAALDAALTPVAPYKTASLVQVFAKAEADPTGLVAGQYRHTMLTDSDLHSTRHARAAVGGLIAGVTGDCHVYVSGGAEGQGPKGGGGLCIVARWEQ